jgi:hypothetical protein
MAGFPRSPAVDVRLDALEMPFCRQVRELEIWGRSSTLRKAGLGHLDANHGVINAAGRPFARLAPARLLKPGASL